MGIIATLLSIGLLILTIIFQKNNKSINPNMLFFALWSFILGLSVLNLYNIKKPSVEAYILISLMLIFYALGNFLYKKSEKTKEKIQKNNKFEISFRIFYILCFCLILVRLIDIVEIVKELFNKTPMWQIRNWILEPYGSNNPILSRRSFVEEAFRSFILTPFYTIIPPITAYYFFNCENKKKKYKMLVISIIILLLSSVAGGGGRLGFIYYCGSFLLAFFVLYKNKKESLVDIKKYKKVIILMLVIAFLFVIIMTTCRTGIGKFIKQIYTYFALPPTLLSLWLPTIKNVEYTYGLTTLFGIHSYFFRIAETIGFDFLVPEIYNEVYNHILNAEIFKRVGYGVGNAFVTPVYYFMIDGGYFAVCVFSLLFGYIVSKAYKNFENNINIRSFTLYTLISYGVFLTFMRIQTTIPAYIISFVLVMLVLRPVKSEEKNEKVNYNELNKKNIEFEIQYDDLITIIVPVYNVEENIEKCIESIINQTYKNLEIILIDDGSTDKSGIICDKYADIDSRIKVIHKENKGVSSARNMGLENADGEWITFVDSDDWIDKDFCLKMLQLAKTENVDYAICSYNKVLGDNVKENEGSFLSKKIYNSKELLLKILNVQTGFGFCHMKLIRKNIIKSIRFNEELKVGEDALFNIELSRNIEKAVFTNEALYNYTYSNNSVVRKFDPNYVQKYLKAMKQMKYYIDINYNNDKEILQGFFNYVSYHVLLIAVNFCFNPLNKQQQIKCLKKICLIDIFKESIKESNYEDLSKSRIITLFTLKYKLYFITMLICKIRQFQFRKIKK